MNFDVRALEQIARSMDEIPHQDLAALSEQARDAALSASSVTGVRMQDQIDLLARTVTPAMEIFVLRCQQAIAVWMPMFRQLSEQLQVHAQTLEAANTSLVKLARSEAIQTLYEVVKYAPLVIDALPASERLELERAATAVGNSVEGQANDEAVPDMLNDPAFQLLVAPGEHLPADPRIRMKGVAFALSTAAAVYVWAEENGGGHNLVVGAGAAFDNFDFSLWIAGIVYVLLMSRQGGHRN